MKHLMLFPVVAGLLVAATCARAANSTARPAELNKLDPAAGHWVFHGKSLATAYGKPGAWTWNENCGWSSDRLYLLCTFDNTWSGRNVKSLVVDTWNTHDKSYWHYEMFSAGAGGKHPFASRMTIRGNVWTENGSDQGKKGKTRERIVYTYTSPTHVRVEFQVSKDGTHWTTVDRGDGVKQGRS